MVSMRSPTSERTRACAPDKRCVATGDRLEDDDGSGGLASWRSELALDNLRRSLLEEVPPVSPRHVDTAMALIGAMDREATIEVVLGGPKRFADAGLVPATSHVAKQATAKMSAPRGMSMYR